MMKVLVCGGRGFYGVELLHSILDRLHALNPITLVIHGAATGADSLAGDWAESNGVQAKQYPADWKKHGRAAGVIRNGEMLDDSKPDLVVAFPGGSETADMVRKAMRAGVKVLEVNAKTD